MRIYIYTGNHGNSLGIADLVGLVQNGVRDCGHDACVSHELMSGHCNIMIEHFIEEAHLRHLLDRKTPGTRYILIGTELVGGGTFNGGVVQKHWHYSNEAYWKLRYEGFLFAAKLADAVWVLSDLAMPPYAALLPDKPVRFLPHGWVSGLDRVQHRDEADKDIDFYFSGTLTEHRRRILEALAREHRVCFTPQSTPDYLRLDQLARSKVCLSLRLSPDNELPSVSRMHFHLQQRSFLLHEAYAKPSLLDPYVLHTPTEDLVEWARAALELTDRRRIADGVLARFRQELPLAQRMKPLLDEALGLADQPRPTPMRHAA